MEGGIKTSSLAVTCQLDENRSDPNWPRFMCHGAGLRHDAAVGL